MWIFWVISFKFFWLFFFYWAFFFHRTTHPINRAMCTWHRAKMMRSNFCNWMRFWLCPNEFSGKEWTWLGLLVSEEGKRGHTRLSSSNPDTEGISTKRGSKYSTGFPFIELPWDTSKTRQTTEKFRARFFAWQIKHGW